MSTFVNLARRYIIPAASVRSDKLRLVFDIEANGFLDNATKAHCIVIADLDSDQVDEYGPDRIIDALAHLARADYLTGHNITGYDLPLLERLHGWRPNPDCTIVDTLVASRLILPDIAALDDQAAAMGDAKLGKLRGAYKLEAWGARLDIPKVGADITNFSVWTPELQARCVGDTAICKALWRFLQPDGYSQQALELEHCVSAICNRISADGVPFDVDAAERLHQQCTARRAALLAQLRQQFPGIKNWNSRKQIIALLMARGWVPEKFTDKGNPSLDEEVLADVARIYPEFAGLSEYFALGVLIGKIITGPKSCCNNVTPDGRIHNAPIHIRTPHSRAQYSNPNLGGIPNPKKGKPVGSECRTLFRDNNGWVFVACDQASLQDRGYAHYLHPFDGGAYGRAFLAGIDTHWQTSIALGLVPEGTARDKSNKVHEAIRESGGKRFRFAFLYGCGAITAGIIIYDIARAVQQIDRSSDLQQQFFGSLERPSETALKRVGSRVLEQFLDASPGLENLRTSLENQARKHGWLPGLDARRVPVRALHTALNFQVTSAEAVVCKRWLAQVYEELRERFHYGPDGDAYVVLWLHDEIVVCCRPEIAEQVGEILTRHAKEVGEHYGLRVPLAAEYKIGRSWAGEPVDVGAEPVTPETAPEPTPSAVAEGLQVVSAGVEPMAPELAPVMPEKTSTASGMSALTSSATMASSSEVTSTDAEPLAPEPAGILDDGGNHLGAAGRAAAGLEPAGDVAAAVGSAPAEPAPPPSIDFGALQATLKTEEVANGQNGAKADARPLWATPVIAEVPPSSMEFEAILASLSAEDRAVVWPAKANGGGEQANQRAAGNGHDQHASEPYAPASFPPLADLIGRPLRNGKISRPFHNDGTASLHIYPDHFHCFGCGAHGNHIDWLMRVEGMSREQALHMLATWQGPRARPISEEEQAEEVRRKLARAAQLWDQAGPITGTLAERYLAEVRRINIDALPSNIDVVLRFHPRCDFSPGIQPCLIALFRDVISDVQAGIHRIALPPAVFAGANVERKMLGPWSAPRAIKLWPATDRLYWGEGIETVAAPATHIEHRGAPMQPAWAAGSSGNLTKLPIIPGVLRLGILVDPDDSGCSASRACGLRWAEAGRTVALLIPRQPQVDFNDLLIGNRRAQYRH